MGQGTEEVTMEPGDLTDDGRKLLTSSKKKLNQREKRRLGERYLECWWNSRISRDSGSPGEKHC